ncbi:unnamed protein product [Soboliphyme baturini]|uniref:40S ribosomal protein S12 n=1 Tax=Soboliphyme baturini TaxID=241478 RepID=A0A183IAC0_9BILA|nr:unnamed protein product [Soboliphyme baturini]
MTTDVETEWQLFKGGLPEAASECCGYKRVGVLPGGQQRSSWWTREVQLAVKEKKAKFNKSLGNKEPSTCV